MSFDLNADTKVDRADLEGWLSAASQENGLSQPYLSGDADLNGSVNASDLNAMALNWQEDVTTWSGGDFNGSGRVDAADLNELALNWQQSVPAAAAVPEPSGWNLTLILLMTSLLAIGRQSDRPTRHVK